MYQRILVPLDGSWLAEQALPVAARIARSSGGVLILTRVAMTPGDIAWHCTLSSMLLIPEVLEADRTKALEYLEILKMEDVLQGVDVITEVAEGNPAQKILAVAEAHHADLIVLCSHGYTGITRWTLGSVAQKIVRHSHAPVLLLHEETEVYQSKKLLDGHPVRIMVALDGSSLAEATLTPAAYLCAALSKPVQGILHLVQIMRLPVDFEYGQDDSLTRAKQEVQKYTDEYLSLVKERIQQGKLADLHLQVTFSSAVSPDVADSLVWIAEADNRAMSDDVLAIATHGRGGLERWVMGSVAEKVLGETKLPLLLVRPARDVVIF